MNQRRSLTPEHAEHLRTLRDQRDAAIADYRTAVVDALNHASIREVMRETGLSMSVIQKWRADLQG